MRHSPWAQRIFAPRSYSIPLDLSYRIELARVPRGTFVQKIGESIHVLILIVLNGGRFIEADPVVDNSKHQSVQVHLPDGASESDLLRSEIFRDLAVKHARAWYEFVNDDLQRMVGNSDLYLITGVTKCASWRIATENNLSPIRSGPHRFPGEEVCENQTVFIRGFKVALRSSDPLFGGLSCGDSEDGGCVSDEIYNNQLQ